VWIEIGGGLFRQMAQGACHVQVLWKYVDRDTLLFLASCTWCFLMGALSPVAIAKDGHLLHLLACTRHLASR